VEGTKIYQNFIAISPSLFFCKVLKEEVLPIFLKVLYRINLKFYCSYLFFYLKATQETILTLEEKDIPKALRTLHRLERLMCYYLAEPSSSYATSSPPVSVTQTPQSVPTTPWLPVPVMVSQPRAESQEFDMPSHSYYAPSLPGSNVCSFLQFPLSMLYIKCRVFTFVSHTYWSQTATHTI
jgi:hypothetical protein